MWIDSDRKFQPTCFGLGLYINVLGLPQRRKLQRNTPNHHPQPLTCPCNVPFSQLNGSNGSNWVNCGGNLLKFLQNLFCFGNPQHPHFALHYGLYALMHSNVIRAFLKQFRGCISEKSIAWQSFSAILGFASFLYGNLLDGQISGKKNLDGSSPSKKKGCGVAAPATRSRGIFW